MALQGPAQQAATSARSPRFHVGPDVLAVDVPILTQTSDVAPS